MPHADLNCIFCKIIEGVAPASIVYKDLDILAFMDICPVNLGQVLVIPIIHAAYLADLDPRVGGRMFEVAQTMAAALRRSGVPCEGINFFLADGAVAMQEIFHIHLHIIPRFETDGFGLKYGANNFQPQPREKLDQAAAKIQSALNALHPLTHTHPPNLNPSPTPPPKNTPLPFTLLHHTNHGPPHYDLLLQIPSQPNLLTWRLTSLPNANPTITRIQDHRPLYLTYEGPISNHRGQVTRIATGTATLLHQSPTTIQLQLPTPLETTLTLPL